MINLYCKYKKERIDIFKCSQCFIRLNHDKNFRSWGACKKENLTRDEPKKTFYELQTITRIDFEYETFDGEIKQDIIFVKGIIENYQEALEFAKEVMKLRPETVKVTKIILFRVFKDSLFI